MRQIVLACCSFFLFSQAFAQAIPDILIRVRQVSYDAVDPDGAGPAKGSVTFKFELKSSSIDVLADGLGLSVAYQSANLMATPGNTVVKSGPINTVLWTQQIDNRSGNTIIPVNYGGRSFDKRMIITFNQNAGFPDATISGTTWTEVARLTYYTLGGSFPQGGYIVPEPGSVVAQNELSSDGGSATYAYLSPEAETPRALGSSGSPLPAHFVHFEAQCTSGVTALTWSTANEKDNDFFEVQKSTDGTSWNRIGRVNGSGNSSTVKTYNFIDQSGGTAQYRIRQVDYNGAFNYSAIVRTTCSSSSFFVNLYPVPAKDKLTLVVGSDIATKTNVSVMDHQGRVVLIVPVNIVKGVNNFSLNVGHLSQGQYYLQSNKDGVKINQRFTIAR